MNFEQKEKTCRWFALPTPEGVPSTFVFPSENDMEALVPDAPIFYMPAATPSRHVLIKSISWSTLSLFLTLLPVS